MTAVQDMVWSAIRTAQERAGRDAVAVIPEDVIGHALHMDFALVRRTAHELAEKGLVRIRRGINYELYELNTL